MRERVCVHIRNDELAELASIVVLTFKPLDNALPAVMTARLCALCFGFVAGTLSQTETGLGMVPR